MDGLACLRRRRLRFGLIVSAFRERAARLGACWYAGFDLELCRQGMARFREACERHGHTPVRHPVRQDVFVARTDAEAAAAVAPAIAAGYRGMRPETLIHGSPATVAERFAAFAELGFTDVIVRQITVAQPLAVRSYELLAEVQALVAHL